MHCRGIWCSLLYSLLLHRVHVSCQSYTYAQPGSYAEFPQWHNGLVDFSFRASRADGLLLYLDSLNNGGDYLILWLQDGLLKARADAGGPTPLETTIGSHLNDIELHWLRIRHYDKQFAFYLDDLPLQYLTYDLNLQFDTRSNVFIGGLPASYTADYEPVTALAPLSGCVEDVRFAEDSISPHSLESRAPITEHELLDGCVDRCIDAECNDGECVTSWSIPSGYFCDCSEAAGVGESCTTGERYLIRNNYAEVM